MTDWNLNLLLLLREDSREFEGHVEFSQGELKRALQAVQADLTKLPIVELKPEWRGISINLKLLPKRIWVWLKKVWAGVMKWKKG